MSLRAEGSRGEKVGSRRHKGRSDRRVNRDEGRDLRALGHRVPTSKESDDKKSV